MPEILRTWLPSLPPFALAVGIALELAGVWPASWAGFSKAYSKLAIQASIVLLGFWVSLDQVARAGVAGLALSTGAIALVLGVSWVLGRLFRTDGQTGTLLSAGTAICGGSAIAVTGSAINAPAPIIAASTAIVFLLNAAGVYVYPVIGRWLGLSDAQFGAWCAIGVHDVAGVVAAARSFSEPALADATVIKLTRVLWIVPVALLLRHWHRRAAPADAPSGRAKAPFPLFVVLFVSACLLRALLDRWLGAQATDAPAGVAKSAATLLLAAALLLIGTAISRRTVASLGWRPLAHGTALWVVVSAAALLAVRAWL